MLKKSFFFMFVFLAATHLFGAFQALADPSSGCVPSFSYYASTVPDKVETVDDESAPIISCTYTDVTKKQMEGYDKLLMDSGFPVVKDEKRDGYSYRIYGNETFSVMVIYSPDYSELLFAYPKSSKLVLPDRDSTKEMIPCPYCQNGKRFSACPECNGSGHTMMNGKSTMFSCPYCNGSGKERCLECYMSGEVLNPDYKDTVPQTAAGSRAPAVPRIDPTVSASKKSTCTACKGKGYTGDCSSCHGTGKMEQTKYAPNYGTGKNSSYTVKIRCAACNGTGKKTCLYCGGSGER